ncbi:hypothetical protein GCM10010124_02550 [Pilimelia terevasa]|uniref:XRE family transcriptional regulator n=2 Tax=Pilimelia terevasa TaxID=53372 RepID=A0A8J3BEC9_9ACTN|nr:hypothetical protein GCM10010124_02550 [Pilimelia terevasa]
MFNRTAEQMGERASLSPRQLSRWMTGEVSTARPVMRRVAERHWGMPFSALIADPCLGTAEISTLPVTGLAVPDALEAAITMAAHESARHAATAGGAVDEVSIEQVHADIRRLAARFAETPPIHVLAAARLARDSAYRLLERTRRPAQTSDLYLAAGQACGLMASASFDLGIWEAAEDQARAAHTYADLVDHAGLRAWSRGTQALIAYWTDQPRRAVDLVEAGLDYATPGASAARLHGIRARAWSHLGDRREVTSSLRAADTEIDSAPTGECVDDLSGDFGWGRSLHEACAATSLLRIGDFGAAAARSTTALDAIPDDPYATLVPERAHIDIALGRLGTGHLDATIDALEPVWGTPIPHRRQALTGRLTDLARTLTTSPVAGERPAIDLRDRIEIFNAEASQIRALTAS